MIPRLSGDNLQLVRHRLRRFREDFGIRTAPVDCTQVIREIGESGRLDLELMESDAFSDAFDARTEYYPRYRCYVIYCRRRPFRWQRTSAGRRFNFTLAHELGHIFCSHLTLPESVKSSATLRQEELEADAFAAELLMPEEVFGQFRSVKEASEALWVSESAARRRMRETNILLRSRVCPACGFGRMPPAARYCRMCGHMTAREPNPDREAEVFWLPPKEETCFLCGQPAVAGENECINCLAPRRNCCTPEYDQPVHYAPAEARFCEVCGSPTVYGETMKGPAGTVPGGPGGPGGTVPGGPLV